MAREPRNFANDDDRIPRSIALTLRAMRGEKGLSGEKLAEKLTDTPGRKPLDEHNNPQQFTTHMISSIEAAESLAFWQFGHYANWSGVPAPILNLVAQLTDHIYEDEAHKAKTFAEATIALCQFVIANLDTLSKLDPSDHAAFLRACYKPTGTPPEPGDTRGVVIARALLTAFPEDAKDAMKQHAKDRFRDRQE